MTFNIIIRAFILFYSIITIGLSRTESVALCVSANGQLERKGHVRNGIIKKGDSIYNGDKITVENNDFLSFITIYEKSMVDIYENSVIKVVNDKKDRHAFPGIALFGGKVIIQMDDNNNSDFILNAPTAIVTSKGTHFIAEYRDELFFNNNTYSVFTVLNGKLKVDFGL